MLADARPQHDETSTWSNLTFLAPFLKADRGLAWFIVVAIVIGSAFSLAEPYLFKRVIDDYVLAFGRFESTAAFFRSLSVVMLIWVGVAFVSRVFRNIQDYLTTTVGDRTGIRLFEHAFSHVLALSMDYHESVKSGEVMRKLQKAREDVTRLIKTGYDDILENALVMAFVVTFSFTRDWRMGLIMAVNIPIFSLVTMTLTRRIKAIQRDINVQTEELHGSAYQALDNPELVKAFTTEAHEQAGVAHFNALTHQNLKRKTVSWRTLGFIQGTLNNLARLTVVWVGAVLVMRGQLTTGDIVLFTFYVVTVSQPLYRLSEVYTTWQEGITSLDRVRDVLAISPSVPLPAHPHRPASFTGRVEFRHVGFRYGEGREVLRDVSFTLEPGKKLAVVGPSGAGKSTIAKLLLRTYDPTAGEILVDGVDLRQWDLGFYRSRIGVVFQENVLFNDTVAANIRYGSFEAGDDAVHAAAEKAHAAGFIARLPQGFETLVGPRGVKLSGGERQRIAIARAVVKRPALFLFDEATSSLDAASERAVQEAIDDVSHGAASLTIAHRLSTVINADEILVLNDEQITERGSHASLLAAGGLYASLVRHQTQTTADLPTIGPDVLSSEAAV